MCKHARLESETIKQILAEYVLTKSPVMQIFMLQFRAVERA